MEVVRKRNIAVPALLLAAGGLLGAQEEAGPAGRVLTVDEAVSLALENNLALEVERVSLDTKARKNRYKWNVFVPTVQVGGSVIRDNEAKETTTSTFEPIISKVNIMGQEIPMLTGLTTVAVPYTPPQVHAAAQISAQLNIVMGLFSGLKAYKLDYEAGLLSLEKAKAQTERDVRKAYNQILMAEENLAVLREGLALAQRQTAQARASFNAGQSAELVYLQAQVAEANKKPSIDEAENNVSLAKAQFAYSLGLPYGTELSLAPYEGGFAYAEMDMDALIKDATERKPDILALRASLSTLKANRMAQALSTLLPTISLSWNTQKYVADWDEKWKDDNLQITGSFTLTVGLQLNSFLPWLSPWQGLKDLDNQIETLNLNLAQLAQGTEIEVYNAVLGLEKTRASIEALRQTANLALRSYNATLTAYRAGSQDLLEVQNAEDQLRQARLAVLAQEFNYRNGLLDLEYSCGVPFGTLAATK